MHYAKNKSVFQQISAAQKMKSQSLQRYSAYQLLCKHPKNPRVIQLFLRVHGGSEYERFRACDETILLSPFGCMRDTWCSFATGRPIRSTAQSAALSTAVSQKMKSSASLTSSAAAAPPCILDAIASDLWACVFASMPICDRRSFACTCVEAHSLHHEACDTQCTYTVGAGDEICWDDLRYLALHAPFKRISSAGEVLLCDERLAGDKKSPVLVACNAIRQLFRDRESSLGRRLNDLALTGRPMLAECTRSGERWLIESLVALSENASVRSARYCAGSASCRRDFWMPPSRLQCIFYSARTASFVLQALSWEWLWSELRYWDAFGLPLHNDDC